MNRIYDVFPFNDELELLELRLQEHWDYIYRFVIIESVVNARSKPKPLFFHENRQRFKPYLEKIRHVIMPSYEYVCPYDPGNYRSGDCMDQQRNMGAMGLFDADDNDIVINCDVDELWRQETLDFMINDTNYLAYCPKQCMSHFYINFVCTTTSDPDRCHGWKSWSKGMRMKTFKDMWRMDLTWVKANGELSTIKDGPTPWPWAAVINHGGWHFSWWGSQQDHISKLDSYGHGAEQDNDEIRRLMASGKLVDEKINCPASIPIIGNMFPQHVWAACAVDDYYPRTITSSMDQYGKYCIPGDHPSAMDFLPKFAINSVV